MSVTAQIRKGIFRTTILAALLFGIVTISRAAGQTLFTTQVPAQISQSDGANVNYELGTEFRSTTAGQITAIRFWKDANESGTHTGRLWSARGQLLASVVFTNETASGWQQQALATPVSITANTTYTVSVNTGATYYAATTDGLALEVISGNLNSVVGRNGAYGAVGQFPTNSWNASNYFRDVVFVPGATNVGTTAVAPTITTQPASQSITSGQTATFSVAATGTSPMTYQWMKGSTAISGATSSSYTTPAETSSTTFSVTVTNSAGSATSNAATLTVNPATTTTALLNASATSLSFGNVNVSSSSTQNVTFTNAGNSNVTISNVSIVNGAGFSPSGISTGLILSPGQSVQMTVAFAPAAAGSVTGSIQVSSNATNSPDTIALSGTGIATPVQYSTSLVWTASTSTVIGYNVYSSTVSGGAYTKLTSTPVASTSYTDSTVQAGNTYYYVVTSVNSANEESVETPAVSVVIP